MRQKFTALMTVLFVMFVTSITFADEPTLKTFLEDRAVAMPTPWYPPGQEPETKDQRSDRVKMIADVIVETAPEATDKFGWYWSPEDLALAAFTKTYYESGHWDVLIHSGKKRGDHGHSTCLGQIWGGGNKLVGTDREHTKACIMEVMKHLTFHQKRCLNERTMPSAWSMAKVFSGYGTGWSCSEGIFRTERDVAGNELKRNGQPIKDHWARERGYTWSHLKTAWTSEQSEQLSQK